MTADEVKRAARMLQTLDTLEDWIETIEKNRSRGNRVQIELSIVGDNGEGTHFEAQHDELVDVEVMLHALYDGKQVARDALIELGVTVPS